MVFFENRFDYLLYHGVVARNPRWCALEGNTDLGRKVWEFLNDIPVETLLGEGRVYGGGLYKMEPKELANVPADAIAALLPSTGARPGKQGKMFQDEAA